MKKFSYEKEGKQLFLVIMDGKSVQRRVAVYDKAAGAAILDGYAKHGVEVEEA